VKDAEIILTLKKETTEADATKISQIMTNIIKRANPEENVEDIEAFVAEHYGNLLKEILIMYGFTTEKEYEAAIKKLTSR